KNGKRVAVVERFDQVGGGCVHWATIPSKALRYAISQVNDVNHSKLFRDAGVVADLGFPELLRSAQSVIDQQVGLRRSFYDRNEVDIIRGQARFRDPHTIEVLEPSGGTLTLRGRGFVIATGSRPYRPPDVDFSHPRVRDSDTI